MEVLYHYYLFSIFGLSRGHYGLVSFDGNYCNARYIHSWCYFSYKMRKIGDSACSVLEIKVSDLVWII